MTHDWLWISIVSAITSTVTYYLGRWTMRREFGAARLKSLAAATQRRPDNDR
jgi:hypothetical protein